MMDEFRHLQDGERSSHDYWGSFQRIITHEGADDEILYSVMVDHPDLVEVAGKVPYQEQEIRRAIESLNGLTPDKIQWEHRLDELNHLLRTHIRPEEDDVFPKAMDVLVREALDGMDGPFTSAKKVL
jgi:hypothetical protein